MHAFAGASGIFFSPAFPTGVWLDLGQELMSKIAHVLTVLHISQRCRI
jgi:hypothetical protein